MKPESMTAGVKRRLILTYSLVEKLITIVMLSSVVFATDYHSLTYSETESVDTITQYISENTKPITITTNVAGTTKQVVGQRTPRLVAKPGESQEVIDAILATFPNSPIMVEVARCESSLNPSADRKGIDGGLFQINQVHLPKLNELGLDRYDLHDNLTYSRMLYDRRGLADWYMSKHCWGVYT